MKRYINLSMAPGNMAENEAGYWCKYSEVKDLEKQNTENERIINSLYMGSSDSKVLKELKTVESCGSYPGCNKGYKGQCCCECMYQLALTKHPLNETYKGSIKDKTGLYVCIVMHNETHTGIIFDRKHGSCEMWRKRK